jgi:hypothetical protein
MLKVVKKKYILVLNYLHLDTSSVFSETAMEPEDHGQDEA